MRPPEEIAPGVAWLPVSFANVYLLGEPGEPWALVDAGLPGRAGEIRQAAEARYGAGARPEAILLTHGHFDHSGSARQLAEEWQVPLYAHSLEIPFLSGRSAYPPPDPTVGGFMALASRLFPKNRRYDVGPRLQELPDGPLPFIHGWEWRHTPGHSPGHISLFRPEDGTLLAGDACSTMDLDSLVGILSRRQGLFRPPAPVTCDWISAWESIDRLARLKPARVACGHGVPLLAADTEARFQEFAARFTPPPYGRYVAEGAQTNETGIVALPPPEPDPLPKMVAAVGVSVLVGSLIATMAVKRSHPIREKSIDDD